MSPGGRSRGGTESFIARFGSEVRRGLGRSVPEGDDRLGSRAGSGAFGQTRSRLRMNDLKKLLPDGKHLSAVDLRKLPADERSAILGAQAAQAADLYRGDRQLTDFEAFGEEDLHGDGPHTEVG